MFHAIGRLSSFLFVAVIVFGNWETQSSPSTILVLSIIWITVTSGIHTWHDKNEVLQKIYLIIRKRHSGEKKTLAKMSAKP